VVAALATLLLPSSARAEATYPGDVDTALGKAGIVETKIAPPMGCQLCHTDPNGGTTTLTPFANYMVATYGLPKAAAVEDANVMASLAQLKAAEPTLWADMQMGIDPNTDPALGASAPPQAQYGCSSSGAGHTSGAPWIALMTGLLVAAWGRRLRRA
jgi:hypothetical protein